MNQTNNFPLKLVVMLVFCMVGLAHAETSDRDKPLHLVSDSMTLDDAKQTSTFEGHVELTQGTLRIVAEKVVVVEDAQGYQHLTASGTPASFRQKMEKSEEYAEGFGERIEYDTRTDTVDFFKIARVKRGQDEVMGDSITYNSKTGIFQARGKTFTAGDKPTRKDRVRAVIQPKKDTQKSSSPNPDGLIIQPTSTLNGATTEELKP